LRGADGDKSVIDRALALREDDRLPGGEHEGPFGTITKEFVNGLSRAGAGGKTVIIKDEEAARHHPGHDKGATVQDRPVEINIDMGESNPGALHPLKRLRNHALMIDNPVRPSHALPDRGQTRIGELPLPVAIASRIGLRHAFEGVEQM
jgi:hypothetical protein